MMSAEWTITRGIPDELPSVVAIYDVMPAAGGGIRTTFRIASAARRSSRAKIAQQLRSTANVAYVTENEDLFSSMRILVYSDGTTQTDFGESNTDPALQSGLAMAELIRLGIQKLPAEASIDTSITKHPMSHDH